jgi:hypothetical protein
MNQATPRGGGPTTGGEPTIGQLVGSLVTETGTLVRQELHLASAELSQKAKRGLGEVGVIGIGGALSHAGLLALIAAVILGLGTLMPMWIAAAIIGVVALGAGWAVTHRGIAALRAIDPLPERTIETLQKDKNWVKEQAR